MNRTLIFVLIGSYLLVVGISFPIGYWIFNNQIKKEKCACKEGHYIDWNTPIDKQKIFVCDERLK